jgi:hypothetical protein
MPSLRAWLRDDKNRDILKMIGGALTVLVAAGWAVLTFVADRHSSGAVTAGPGAIAAGHDISGNTITLAPPGSAAPPAAPPAARVP